ncbi:aminoglycoside phosphotransferase family protein [Dictyobacter aurantiacus]|uniref:Aminoglycoside phosphotransferase domain-containing protein n=1 Tax=Dictyobacter aurantiacus TaxID=1936993 RepID=A0A401ZQ90_9CHLR|nr:aminoglycoside phosphotransferase family protein [Dictyobacter aurantiacus]GCE09039.1 hypothetical protein KDAU_63680 [Dictyobacter aurantiacus]
MSNINMIPLPWRNYILQLPMLAETVQWKLLRKWGLSEVWRITMRNGTTWIAKKSSGSMAVELPIYQEVLLPLHAPRPQLHSYWLGASEHLFILEDVGFDTLEQQPQTEHFLESARVLARLRCAALVQLQHENASNFEQYRISADYYLQALDYLLQCGELETEKKAVLQAVKCWLPDQLHDLYSQLPLTLCHNDYHVKNLVISDDTVVPVDWAMAYLSPYLGDLYSLVHAAAFRKVETQLMLQAYEAEVRHWAATYPDVGLMLSRPLEWQIALGAVCILITSIRWTLTEAMYELPETKKWIPAMIRNIDHYAQKIS